MRPLPALRTVRCDGAARSASQVVCGGQDCKMSGMRPAPTQPGLRPRLNSTSCACPEAPEGEWSGWRAALPKAQIAEAMKEGGCSRPMRCCRAAEWLPQIAAANQDAIAGGASRTPCTCASQVCPQLVWTGSVAPLVVGDHHLRSAQSSHLCRATAFPRLGLAVKGQPGTSVDEKSPAVRGFGRLPGLLGKPRKDVLAERAGFEPAVGY
jgi:hypothetical protein